MFFRNRLLQLTGALLVLGLLGVGCTKADDAQGTPQGVSSPPTPIQSLGSPLVSASPETGIVNDEWRPSDPLDRGAVAGDPIAWANLRAAAVHEELRWRVPDYCADHPEQPMTLRGLLEDFPFWYEQVLPDGTPLQIVDSVSDTAQAGQLMRIAWTEDGCESSMPVHGENTFITVRAMFRRTEPNGPEPRTTALLFTTTKYISQYIDQYGQFPVSFAQLCEVRQIRPAAAHVHTAADPWNEQPGIRLELNPSTFQMRSLEVTPEGRRVVRLNSYRLSAHGSTYEAALLEPNDPRLTAPGFQPFLEASIPQ